MKTYRGFRTDDGAQVKAEADGVPYVVRPRYDLRNHSPDGFEWGYGGSGPAQLALALLADALDDDERAMRLYQDFKWQYVSTLPHEGWQTTREEIVRIADRIERAP